MTFYEAVILEGGRRMDNVLYNLIHRSTEVYPIQALPEEFWCKFLTGRTSSELRKHRNLGMKAFRIIETAMAERGWYLQDYKAPRPRCASCGQLLPKEK